MSSAMSGEEPGRPERKEGSIADSISINSWHHPPSFYCPISQQCMHDPVVLADGHSYERRHIERWLLEHSTSPVSGLRLPHQIVLANHALRNAIEEYFQQIFQVHRRAIRRTFQAWNWTLGPGMEIDAGSNAVLLRTIDALMQCSLLMNADLSVERALWQIAEEAKSVVGAEVGSVFLVDASHQYLLSTVNSTGRELKIPITGGIAGHVATTGEPVICNDAYADSRFDQRVDLETGFKTENLICVPLQNKRGSIMGVIQLLNKTGFGMARVNSTRLGSIGRVASGALSGDVEGQFTPQDLQFLQVFASQAATTIIDSGAFSEGSGERRSAPLQADREAGVYSIDSVPEDSDDAQGSDSSVALRASSGKPPKSSKGIVGLEDATASLVQAPRKARPARVAEFLRSAQVAQLLSEASHGWHFDVKHLNELTGNKPLSTLSVHLFEHHGLVDHFHLDRQRLAAFFAAVERGYSESAAYHNASHAACVMHMVHCFLEQGGLAQAAATGLAGTSPELVKMACLFAAAVHDLEHLGVTNAFLMKTSHERAVRYNDRHVNESHHLAVAFSLLLDSDHNFAQGLSVKDFKRFRALTITLVEGTDMDDHGQILKTFKERICSALDQIGAADAGLRRPPCSLSEEQDAHLLLQVAIKCADLGHLTLTWEEHLRWVQCLEQEFFAQGDTEKTAGIAPISFLMDREKPGPSQTQVGFYKMVVMPLFEAFTSVLPGTAPLFHGAAANLERWQALDAAKA